MRIETMLVIALIRREWAAAAQMVLPPDQRQGAA